ncbi:Probable membrane protein Cj0124c [hydrothermal vent metagenome]|uniref:Probable membrane protein Cj0124c n=1 Tax=hydrothermal vent metagenome TaxID=652676 RepID=A0A1W1D3H4_9ZZZZ
MNIKRYTVASAILITLVGWYVYAYVSQETLSLEFFGIVLPPLSLAVWIILPMILLYIFSVLHMAFHSIFGNFKLRKYEKDSQKIADVIIEAYLGKKDRHHSFQTEGCRVVGDLIDHSKVTIDESISSIEIENDKIKKVIQLIQDIQDGKVADLEPYHLDVSNELVIQNNHNKYKNGVLKVEDILNNTTNYDEALVKEVYCDFAKTAPLAKLEKYKEFMTKEALFNILARLNTEENKVEASVLELISFIKSLELSSKDYIEISKSLANAISPEDRIRLFELLSEDVEKAMEAYLYTLFDLEMNSMAAEILENSQPDEFVKFKAYFALKDANKNFDINLFI